MFYPSPTVQQSNSSARKDGPRPFIEFTMLMRSLPEHSITTYKNMKLSVQPSVFRFDKGFVLSLYDMYCHAVPSDINESVMLNRDIETSRKQLQDLMMHDNVGTQSNSQRCIFENIDLAPIDVSLAN